MKLLLIAFCGDGNMMYPHLRHTLEYLKQNFETDYYTLAERGYGFDVLLKFNKECRRHLKGLFKDFKRLKRLKRKKRFDKIIAVDHFAFWFASMIFGRENVIFWSFDIIAPDLPYYHNPIVKYVLKQNKKLIEKGAKVIIQTPSRLEFLENTLGVKIKEENVFLFPVSIPKLDIEISHTLPNNEKIMLMQTSSFDGNRFARDILAQYQKDDNYVYYMHGLVHEDFSDLGSKYEKLPILSTLLVSGQNLYKVIKNSDIGLIAYASTKENAQRLYRSTGQLAEFLRMGKPVITYGKNDLGKNIEANGAGVEIKDVTQLKDAVEKIRNNYEEYSKNALNCFMKDMEISEYLPKLAEWIKK